MAVERTDHPDGTYTIKADKKDLGDLKGSLRELSDKDNAAKETKEKEFGRRDLINRKGAKKSVPGDRVERRLNEGFTVANAQCGITMPAKYLGFAEDGRIVYSERDDKDEWEAGVSKQGYEGWVICR